MRSKTAPRYADLEQRREPVQLRAVRSRANILEVAAALLEDVGLDAFNTNLLAERANVRVRTIYRYFPNKFAVIAAVGEELMAKWADWNAAHLAAIGVPNSDWRTVLSRMIAEWFANVSQESGGWAVLQALGAIPQLRALDRAAFEGIAKRWEDTLHRRAPHLGADAVPLSFAIVSTFYGFIDSYVRVPPEHRAHIARELETMIAGRLAPVFDDQLFREAM